MQETSKYPLSIITINRNNREGLRQTIESVVNQTYRDFEYIVIDGASTDGSVEVIKQYHDRIHYWVSEPDTGIYNAMNKGIRVAQGEYLLFLNSGDWLYEKEVLFKVIPCLINTNSVYAADIVFKDKFAEHIITHPLNLSFTYLMGRSIAHQSAFISKSLFVKYGFYDENLSIVADWAFFINALGIKNTSYYPIPIIASVFDLNGVSSNEYNKKTAFEDKISVLKKHLPAILVDELYEIKKLKNRLGENNIRKLIAVTSGKKSKFIFNLFLSAMNTLVILKNRFFVGR